MNRFFKIVVSICLIFISISVYSQARKQYNPTANWTNFNFHYQKNDKLNYLGQIAIRRPYNNQTLNGIGNFFPFTQISFIHILGGITVKHTDHWTTHYSLRYRVEPFGTKLLIPRVFLGHTGIHKKIRFYKQVMYERMEFLQNNVSDHNRLRFLVSFGLDLKVKNRKLKPILSYELFKRIPLLTDLQPRFETSRLRFDINYELTEKVGIGVFVMRNTGYTYVLGTYDEFGNVVTPEGNLNRITPIVGFQLFLLFKNSEMNQLGD